MLFRIQMYAVNFAGAGGRFRIKEMAAQRCGDLAVGFRQTGAFLFSIGELWGENAARGTNLRRADNEN
jgi:hypothetical protein